MKPIFYLSVCLLAFCEGTPSLKQFQKITEYQRPGETCSTVKHFYYSPVFKKSWSDALVFCNTFKMDLASFQTKHELDFVVREIQKISNLQKVWTGGIKLSSDVLPHWSVNGKAVSKDVLGGLSFSQVPVCLNLQKSGNAYQFHSADCDTVEYFMCEQSITNDYC